MLERAERARGGGGGEGGTVLLCRGARSCVRLEANTEKKRKGGCFGEEPIFFRLRLRASALSLSVVRPISATSQWEGHRCRWNRRVLWSAEACFQGSRVGSTARRVTCPRLLKGTLISNARAYRSGLRRQFASRWRCTGPCSSGQYPARRSGQSLRWAPPQGWGGEPSGVEVAGN